MNMIHRYFTLAAVVCLFISAAASIIAQPTPGRTAPAPGAPDSLPFVSPIFVDNMVLQRGKPDTLWCWSAPRDTVRVQIGDNAATATAGNDHRWEVKIQPPAPGGPYSVKISGRQTVELRNVLVGDVWLCGGQSNMGLPLRFTKDGENEVKAADFPQIRFFTVHIRFCTSADGVCPDVNALSVHDEPQFWTIPWRAASRTPWRTEMLLL